MSFFWQTILTTESLRVSFFFFIIIYRTDCYEFPHTCGELLSLLEFRVRISSAHCDQKTVDLIQTVVEGLLAKFRELTVVFFNVIFFPAGNGGLFVNRGGLFPTKGKQN